MNTNSSRNGQNPFERALGLLKKEKDELTGGSDDFGSAEGASDSLSQAQPETGHEKPTRPEPSYTGSEQKEPATIDTAEMGDLLMLDGRRMILYRQFVPDKNCDFIYELAGDGSLVAKGVPVERFEKRRLASFDSETFRELIRKKRWDYSDLIPALEHPSYERYLIILDQDFGSPSPAPAPSKPEAQNGQNGQIRRGTQVKILNGQHTWEAIYWGRHTSGEDILAHSPGGRWRLTPVDLKRFGDKVEIGEAVDEATLERITEGVMAAEAKE